MGKKNKKLKKLNARLNQQNNTKLDALRDAK